LIQPISTKFWQWMAFLLFVLQFGYVNAANEVPAIRSHVSDYAKVLGARAPLIDKQLAAFEATTGHQVFLLTVKSIGADASIDEYAVTVFEKWKLGRKGVDDGVLFVVAVDDRKMRIEVGYGLEGTLTDLKSSRIIRDLVTPKFKKGNYAAGIEIGLYAILSVLQNPSAGMTQSKPVPSAGDVAIGKLVFQLLAGSMFLLFMFMSLFAGILGLLLMSLIGAFVPIWLYPDWRGQLLTAGFIALWLFGRWRLVFANVKKYHLKDSRNKAITWIRVFLFTFGMGRPKSKRSRKSGGRDSGFHIRFGTSNGSPSSSGSSSGGGGRSGGGGASGSW
jgi:uncharacterized protein